MALPTRADVINFYAKKIGAKSYLEIGVQTGATFHAVQIDHKVGVDPDPHSEATIHTTSDLFFSLNGEKFDIIFVDGLHHWETALRDIDNAVAILNDGGVIVVDDIAPRKEAHQTRHISDIHWTGDVWKCWFAAVTRYREDFNMFSLDVAFGVGVMVAGETALAPNSYALLYQRDPQSLGWGDYLAHRNEYHKMIDYSDFLAGHHSGGHFSYPNG